MDFDPTITLGNVLQIVTWAVIALSAYFALKSRLDVLESMLKAHAATLQAHAARLDRYEASIVDVISDLQRMIGHVEGMRRERGARGER